MNKINTLLLLSESCICAKEGMKTRKEQRDYISKCKKTLTPAEKAFYTAQENITARNMAEASTSMFNALNLINGKNTSEDNLSIIWNKLDSDTKKKITREILRRNDIRKSSNNELTVNDIENITIKLKNTISLINKYEKKEPSIMLPDSDFLLTFYMGLSRHFIYDYLYTGSLKDLQKEVDGNEIFNIIRGIVDNNDRQLNNHEESSYKGRNV